MEGKYYLGIDLHRHFFTYHASDNDGREFLRGKLVNSVESVDKLIQSFPLPPKAVVEATRNWMWLVSCLTKQHCQVTLAHPFRTKAIAAARIKTDSIDAKTLCDLLRANLVPASYVATLAQQDNRELARGRIALVHYQTMLKNRIRAILGKENLNFFGSDLFGKAGKKWLAKQSLSEAKRQMIGIYLQRLTDLKEAIEKVETLINQKSSRLPEVKLLTSIPGIGTTTAFLLASEIGNIQRFDSSKQFASYFGLVPRLNQSGNHAYYGRITKLGNPFVRWSLVQAAHRLARTNPNYQRFVARIAYRGGKKKAIVALARKLATIIFCVLKENRPFIKDYQQPKVRPAIIPERVRFYRTAFV